MTRSAPSSPPVHVSPEPAASSPARKPGVRALIRAVGGPRYVVALSVDSIGAGLQRPFLLLYGIDVLHLATLTAGLAMTGGAVAGLGCMPLVGRWLDRGARSTVVAAAMLVRVIGTMLLLAAPAGHDATVWMFAVAALFLGTGGQAVSAAHAALVSTISAGRQRDAALAAGRSVRNAGLGLGALLATASLTAGTAGLRALAAGTAMSYLLSASLTYSVRVRASVPPAAARDSISRDIGSARFQLSTGFSLAISPAIITALAARGPAALWGSLTAATLLAAAAVARPAVGPDLSAPQVTRITVTPTAS